MSVERLRKRGIVCVCYYICAGDITEGQSNKTKQKNTEFTALSNQRHISASISLNMLLWAGG